jgi:holo-[acyl-carrier protein] synthase
MALRVGIDLVSVGSVADAIAAHADRYLKRVYTDRELDDCRKGDGVDAERLAGRFAAKEAAMKALRADEGAIPWRAIGVRRNPGGSVELELTGPAEALAKAAGVADIALSLAHEDGFATAVVVADVTPRGNTQ